jgi:hypothetical protein
MSELLTGSTIGFNHMKVIRFYGLVLVRLIF